MNNQYSPPDVSFVGHPVFEWNQVASALVLAVVLTIAVYHEVLARRIPNGLTYTAMIVGVSLAWSGGGTSVFASVAGLVAGFGFLFVFFLFGGVGGGDVKLMGAAGALMGFSRIQSAIVFTAILGGVMAVLYLVWHRDFWGYLTSRVNRILPGKTSAHAGVKRPEIAVPYGLAIAGGCLLAMALNGIS